MYKSPKLIWLRNRAIDLWKETEFKQQDNFIEIVIIFHNSIKNVFKS